MKHPILIAALAVSLSACGILKPHEKATLSQAQQAGLVAVHKPHFDVSYVSPDANLGQYKKIILSDLDLSATKILKPNTSRPFEEPWELNNDDKKYYQAKYEDSAKKFLFDDGVYAVSTTPAADTLVLKTKITEIAPLASKDDFKGRPNLMDVYSEGFGRMTIAFELYDSVSNKLIVVTSDEHDLGNIWEKNNRVQNNFKIKLAFDFWLRNLKKELKHSSK